MTIGNLTTKVVSQIRKLSTKILSMDTYVWFDLELTGLEVEDHEILEAACIITTTDLNYIHEGINLVIHQPEDVLKSMNYWSLVHHAKTGLTAQSRESKISVAEADERISRYIKSHTDPNGIRYLAGNSVYMDKRFIEKYMPSVNSLLHYRIVDVSTLKILFSHWYPNEFQKLPKKKVDHRALNDIKQSILELKEYRNLMKKTENLEQEY